MNLQEGREGGGIQTFSGYIVSPLWPNKDTISIVDIAHGEGFLCRFACQCDPFYSVGQHSTLMARWFRKRGMILEAKYAIIHEAAESLGMMDMPHPIKYLPQMRTYKSIEGTYQTSLYRVFGLFDDPPKAVKELDLRMCAAEAKVVMNPIPRYAQEVDTSDIIVKPWRGMYKPRTEFLKEFSLLFPDWDVKFPLRRSSTKKATK